LKRKLDEDNMVPVPSLPPALATDRVANLLLAYKGRSSVFAPGRAAEDIARQMARDMLGPLLDTACARLAYVLKRVVEASSDRALASGEWEDCNEYTVLVPSSDTRYSHVMPGFHL
jgi:hypothetical protein